MDKDEAERLKREVGAIREHHKKLRRWFRTQFHTVGICCLKLLKREEIDRYWSKFDSAMQNMTSLGPHYIAR